MNLGKRLAAMNALRTPERALKAVHPEYTITPALHRLSVAIAKADRLLISIPPQEGKTELLRAACISALSLDPKTRIIYGSYADTLARRSGQWVRNALRGHPEFQLRVREDSHAKNEWQLYGGGGMVSLGRGAGVSGKPGDLVIIDDPYKEGEAKSETIRAECWEWFTQGVIPRLSPQARVVVCMTRWHQADIIGELSKTGRWEQVTIPAFQDDRTRLEEGLWDDKGWLISARGRTAEQWEDRRDTVGPRAWQALFQGSPTASEGNVFKRAWFQHYADLPDMTTGTVVQSWDLTYGHRAGKAKLDKQDYVAGQVWLKQGADAYLLDSVHARMTFTEQLDAIRSMKSKWANTSAIYIEKAANGAAAIDTLSREIPGIIAVTPNGSKETRADSVAPFIRSGNVYFPVGSDTLEDELADFPTAEHDDQVDALTQALSQLFAMSSPFERVRL